RPPLLIHCLVVPLRRCTTVLFFLNDTPTTEIYTLSLHDALPILPDRSQVPYEMNINFLDALSNPGEDSVETQVARLRCAHAIQLDRKSTRLNSSHVKISYAVFCLKKKKKNNSRKALSKWTGIVER